MFLSARAFALAVPLFGLLHNVRVAASPLDISKEASAPVRMSSYDVMKRQDPGPESAADSSGIESEDEDPAQIAADGTGPLRSAVPARALYTNQPTATWYQVDTASIDSAASFTSYVSTQPENSPVPIPNDPNQIRGPNPWNVDHIFELQVIGEAFKANKPTNIPAAAWASATNAVFTSGDANSAIATAVTNLKNLQGIPNALNSFKKQVFTGNLTGKGGPSSGSDATFFNFYGPAIQRYLESHQDDLMAGTVDDVGNQLQSAGANNADIKSYFTSYASYHYQGCIEFLSTWNGKDLNRASPSTQTTTSSLSAVATNTILTSSPTPTLSCYHMAEPDNACAAIADSEGWCECGDNASTYAIMTGTAGQPCAWTATPPTTAFNCAATQTSTVVPVTSVASSTSTCYVPDGCVNLADPPSCAVACT